MSRSARPDGPAQAVAASRANGSPHAADSPPGAAWSAATAVPPRIPFLLLLAGWLVLAALDVGQTAVAHVAQGRELLLRNVVTFTVPAYVMLALLSPLVFAFTRRFPLRQERLPVSVAAHGAASVVFPLVHLSASAVAVWLLTAGETQILPLIQRWSFAFVAVDVLRYWALVCLYQALWSARRVHARELELEQLRARHARMKADLAEARLSALAHQLRPHFLFNSLNVISGMALKNQPESAATLLARLSDLLRRSLRQSETVATLAEELEFVDSYLSIEQARLGERLRVHRDIQPGLESCTVPSFLLQPLVENAILHGVAPRASGGAITLRVRANGGTLRVDVEDDGAGIGAGPIAEGIGLTGTRQRLATMYGNAGRLVLEPLPQGGTRVTAHLPAGCDTAAPSPS